MFLLSSSPMVHEGFKSSLIRSNHIQLLTISNPLSHDLKFWSLISMRSRSGGRWESGHEPRLKIQKNNKNSVRNEMTGCPSVKHHLSRFRPSPKAHQSVANPHWVFGGGTYPRLKCKNLVSPLRRFNISIPIFFFRRKPRQLYKLKYSILLILMKNHASS